MKKTAELIFAALMGCVAAMPLHADTVTVSDPGTGQGPEYERPRAYLFETVSGVQLIVNVGAERDRILTVNGRSVLRCGADVQAARMSVAAGLSVTLDGCAQDGLQLSSPIFGNRDPISQARDFRNRLIEAYDRAWRVVSFQCPGVEGTASAQVLAAPGRPVAYFRAKPDRAHITAYINTSEVEYGENGLIQDAPTLGDYDGARIDREGIHSPSGSRAGGSLWIPLSPDPYDRLLLDFRWEFGEWQLHVHVRPGSSRSSQHYCPQAR